MTNGGFQKKTMEELERVSAETHLMGGHLPVWVVLDDIRSMHNVGSVFRTADAFNTSGIYLCGYTPVPPHRDIQKTALGATESVQWQYEEDLIAFLQEKKKDHKIYAVEQTHGSQPLQHFHLTRHEKYLFIFGNEVLGVNKNALALCDGCIEIPQFGSKHSLNISVSVGVVLWELVRNW